MATWKSETTYSDGNRIGAACWYCSKGKAKAGHLRMWSHCNDEQMGGPVAVVEDDQTLIPTTVDVDKVCFAAVPPWPRTD